MTEQIDSCERIVDDAMTELVLEFPIYAQLIARIGVKIVEIESEKHIAWTNGKAIFVNRYYVERCNRYPKREDKDGNIIDVTIGFRQMVFILAHELSHLLLESYNRAKPMGVDYESTSEESKQKRDLWNCATDYEINSNLHNNEETDQSGHTESKEVGRMPEFVLYESKYRNKIAEDIYEDLQQQAKQQQQQGNQGNNGQGGSNGNGGGSGNNSNDNSNGPGSFSDDDTPRYVDFDLDKHEPITDEATKNEIIAKIADVCGNRTQGVGSSALDRIIQRVFKKEPFNWRKALAKYIRGWMKDNYTWNKPSRAGIANNIILPSQGKTPKMHIAVAIDTSGSMSDKDIQYAFNEIFHLLSSYKFTITIIQCDAKINRVDFISKKRDLKDINIQGRGGTCFTPVFEYLNNIKNGTRPDILVYFTDGYGERYIDKNLMNSLRTLKTIFVICNNQKMTDEETRNTLSCKEQFKDILPLYTKEQF